MINIEKFLPETLQRIRSSSILVICILALCPVKVNAIGNGRNDQHAAYTVRVGGFCSGVLITPRWVLTANHCITGIDASPFKETQGRGVKARIKITIVPKGSSNVNDSTAKSFMHTNTESDDIIVRKTSRMKLGPFDGRGDASRDLALIRLDEPVPLSFARPLHPPLLGVSRCPTEDFQGRISGFDGGNVRKFSNSQDYSRDTSPTHGYVYENEWILPVPVTGVFDFQLLPVIGTGALVSYDAYKGIEAGDSGGPLVYEGRGGSRLCGIASGTYGAIRPHIMCGPIPCAAVGQLHAAVDSPETLAWLKANIIVKDMFGNTVFDGECSAAPYRSCGVAMAVRLIAMGII